MRNCSSRQGPASTTWVFEASGSDTRREGAGGVSLRREAVPRSGRGLCRPGLPPPRRCFPPLPSPFEPPRNATSPTHAHLECWPRLFPGSGGWSGRKSRRWWWRRPRSTECGPGGQALPRAQEVFFSEGADRAGGRAAR